MNLYKYVSKLSFSLICALCGMSRFSIMFEHCLCYVCFTHDFSVTCKMYLRNKGIECVCSVAIFLTKNNSRSHVLGQYVVFMQKGIKIGPVFSDRIVFETRIVKFLFF